MNILALSPHTDDSELGAGGSIARWVQEGASVHIVAFSTGHPSCGSNKNEFFGAAKTLDTISSTIQICATLCDFEDRHFGEWRQEILDKMIWLRKQKEPDLVLVPSRVSVHQDHEVVAAEAVRAFRDCSILGYEQVWSSVGAFSPQLYVRLEGRHIRTKSEALACYGTQSERAYFHQDIISGLARFRGTQVRAHYAEAFEVVRWVM